MKSAPPFDVVLTHDIPVDALAARVVSRGVAPVEFNDKVERVFQEKPQTYPYTGPKKYDLTGVRIGNLTVVGFDVKPKCKPARWVARCDCGLFVMRRADAINRARARPPTGEELHCWMCPYCHRVESLKRSGEGKP